MSNDKISAVFPREAAALELEKILSAKAKGDCITAKEVLDATGFSVEKMRGRIKTWAKKTNVVVRSVPGDGYRILTDAEHTDASRRKAHAAAKQEREGLRVLVVTDRAKIDESQVRRIEWMMPRAASRVARAEQDIKETRQEFKLSERVPLRLAK